MSEAELLKLAEHVVEHFFESYPAATTSAGQPNSLEATIVRLLGNFLKHYGLEPAPDFADHTRVAVMYESGPEYRDRPLLGFSGSAQATKDGAPSTFNLSLPLNSQPNRVESGAIGIASTARWIPGE
jgi:hypothetical protein